MADNEQPPAKKAKGRPKKEKKAKIEADSDAADVVDVPVKKTKAAAKKSQKAKSAEAIESDGAPPPKKARGRKKSAKVDDDDDQGESIAKGEDSGEAIPPVKKSRASRKGATAEVSKILETEEDNDMEEVAEEAQKPKKGRKNNVGKGAKDEVSASVSFILDFRLTVLRHLAPQQLKRTYQI